MSSEPNQNQELLLTAKLEQDPSDWDTRQQLAHLLYDQGQYGQAAVVIWEADQIPSTDLDIAFAARILAKDQPRKAIRLLATVLQHNKGKSVQNMGMANALLHHGMVLQAARFYGAALEADPDLVNPDLEHFILWTDEEQTLWGDFKDRRPKLGELPWMARDPMEALKLTSRVALHTTPISVPKLKPVLAENLKNSLYQQSAEKDAKITPPPAVTIPADRVQAKHRRYDSTMGAAVDTEAKPKPAAPAKKPVDATQEFEIPAPAQKPGTPALDPTQEFEIPAPAQKPGVAATPPPAPIGKTPAARPGATPPPAPAGKTPAAKPAAAQPAAAQPAPTVQITKGGLKGGKIAKPTVGPDGKIRRASAAPPADAVGSPLIRKAGQNPNAEVDVDAIEAKAQMEITQKTKIGNLAKAAAAAAADDEQPNPMKKTAAQGKEPLPAMEAKAQTSPVQAVPAAAAGPGAGLSDDAKKLRLDEMKKTRAVARQAARETRLTAAAAGVPLPSTEGRKGEWYYIHESQAVGPILAEELKEKLNDPTMKPPLKMIWTGGMERWMPVYECPQLWQELNEAGV